MPVQKSPGGPTIITPAKSLNTLDGQVSGSTRDCDWSVTEEHDPSIALQADLGDASPGATIVLKAASGTSGLAEITLPASTGSLASVSSIEIPIALETGASTPVPLDMPATMRLRKVGDLVFCSLDEISIASFPGVSDSDIHMVAGTIPAGYRPVSDVVSAPMSFFSPSITGVANPTSDGRMFIMKNIQGDGFTNGDPIDIACSSFFWCTNELDS